MKRAIVALAVLASAPGALAQSQGVTKDEILVGSILDQSGPLAGFGKQTRLGMMLRIDEVNEQGGVNGRKLRLIVEDDGYDPRRAVLGAQKLVNQDKVFAVIGHIGTAHNMAAMPIQFEKNVFNFFPGTGAREMSEPPNRLKYAFAPAYFDQMRQNVPRLARQKNVRKVCTVYQDDEFGLEVMRGAEAGLKAAGMELADRATYKRGATDFSSQVARLKAAGCEMVVLGTVIRETIGVIGESRKTGFNPVFLGTNASYTHLIHALGGRAMDGLYATHTAQHPYLDESSQPIRFWALKYKTRFGEDPAVFSIYGYIAVDAFIKGASKAGPNLNPDTFVKAMDSVTIPPDIFGSPEMTFGPAKRLGSNMSRLSQIQDGRWRVVEDYPKVK